MDQVAERPDREARERHRVPVLLSGAGFGILPHRRLGLVQLPRERWRVRKQQRLGLYARRGLRRASREERFADPGDELRLRRGYGPGRVDRVEDGRARLRQWAA